MDVVTSALIVFALALDMIEVRTPQFYVSRLLNEDDGEDEYKDE